MKWVCCLGKFAAKKTKAWLFIEGQKNLECRNSKPSMMEKDAIGTRGG